MATIHELLSNPEKLLALSNDELKKLLEPYIPAARKALLPQEKPGKLGMHARVMFDVLKDPKIAADLAKLRATMKK